MRKEAAVALNEAASRCAQIFSDPNREYNPTHETFTVEQILPLSESVAAVILLKNTGKKALAIFLFIKNKWEFFFPTDSHLLGLANLHGIKERLEAENYSFNFAPVDEFPRDDQ